MEDLDLVHRAEARRAASRCSPRPRSRRRAATARAVRCARCCATGSPRRRGRSASTAGASHSGRAGERRGARRGDAQRVAALRRLARYVRHNRRYYAVWVVVTLGYVAGFVAVPMLVGWCVGAVAHGLPARRGGAARRVARRRDHRARGAALFLAHARVQRGAPDRVRAARRHLRQPAAAPAELLLPLAHRRHHEPLRERPVARCACSMGVGPAESAPDARALRRRDRRDDDGERAARAARAAAVSALHPDRARVRPRDPPLEPAHPGGARRGEQPAPGDDLGDRGGEGVRDGAVHRAALRGGEPGAVPARARARARERRDARDHGHAARARDGPDPARRRTRHRRGPDGGVRLLHVRDVRLRADLPDLHHGLGGGARAARRGVDAADRRAALARCRRSPTGPTPCRCRACAARSSSGT